MEDQNNNQAPNNESTAPFNPPAETPAQVPSQPKAEFRPQQQPAQAPSPFQAAPQPVSPAEQSMSPLQTDTTYQQPLTPPVAPTAVEQPAGVAVKPKSKKKWLVVLVAIILLLLVGGGAASAYYFAVYQRPENVLLDAFNKLSMAKAIQSNATITLNKDLGSGAVIKDITIKANTATNQTGMLDSAVNLELDGKAMSIGSKAVISLADNALYYKVNNVTDAIGVIAESAGVAGEMPTEYLDALASIQDQWVKVTLEDIKNTSESAGSELECTVNVLKKQNSDSGKEYGELYKKNPFIVVKEQMGVKDNLIGYKLNLDQAKATAFSKALEETQVYKDLMACSPSGSVAPTPKDTPSIDSAVTDSTVYTVWVDQWSHELKSVQVAGESGEGSDKTTYNGTVNLAYDPNVAIDVPTDVIDFEEFMTRLQDVFGTMVSGVEVDA